MTNFSDYAITLFADGGCFPNPGKGAWACILVATNDAGRIVASKELTGVEPVSTNNRSELLAVVHGLEALKEPCNVNVVSDSQWVVQGGNGAWSRGANPDLWSRLEKQEAIHRITFEWVKGHAGHTGNERAHMLVERTLRDWQRKGLPTP